MNKKYFFLVNSEMKNLFRVFVYGFIFLNLSCNKTSSIKNEDKNNLTTESNSLDQYSINELFKKADTLF